MELEPEPEPPEPAHFARSRSRRDILLGAGAGAEIVTRSRSRPKVARLRIPDWKDTTQICIIFDKNKGTHTIYIPDKNKGNIFRQFSIECQPSILLKDCLGKHSV